MTQLATILLLSVLTLTTSKRCKQDEEFSCPDDTTCCPLPPGQGIGCCPYPEATCCQDKMDCCPSGKKCCPDHSFTCSDDQTCCHLKDGDWGCCPLGGDAVCCSDGEHCCPHLTECDLAAGTCTPQ